MSTRRLAALLYVVCLWACALMPRSVGAQEAAAAVASAERTRGVELYRHGDNEGALKALRAATKQNKTDADAWYYFGLALIKQQKVKDAQKALTTAATLRPQHAPTLTALAYALVLQGKLGEAGRAADNALKLEPQSAEANYFAGVVNYRLNSMPRALENIEAAMKANPTYGPALFLKSQILVNMAGRALSTAYEETQDMRELLIKKSDERFAAAAASLEQFIKQNPNDQDVVLAQEQLKTLSLYQELVTKPASERTVLSPREVTTRAIITAKPEPTFTERARQRNTTGEVILRLVLGTDGRVVYILPVKTLPDGLTESSIAAARRIKFIPATKDGRPVAQFVTIVYNFNIY